MLMKHSKKARLFRRALSAYLVYKRKMLYSYSPEMKQLQADLQETINKVIAKNMSIKRINYLFRLVYIEGLEPGHAARCVCLPVSIARELCLKKDAIIDAREKARKIMPSSLKSLKQIEEAKYELGN